MVLHQGARADTAEGVVFDDVQCLVLSVDLAPDDGLDPPPDRVRLLGADVPLTVALDDGVLLIRRGVGTGAATRLQIAMAFIGTTVRGDAKARSAVSLLATRRKLVRGASFVQVVVGSVRAVTGWYWPVALPASVVIALAADVPPHASVGARLQDVLAWAMGPWLLVLSLAVHEAAHLWALRKLRKAPQIGALQFSGLQLSVIRPPLARRRTRALVAAAGPAVAGTVCAAGLVLGWPSAALSAQFMLLLAVHLASLLPLSPDGRQMWIAVQE